MFFTRDTVKYFTHIINKKKLFFTRRIDYMTEI